MATLLPSIVVGKNAMRLVELRPPRLQLAAWETRKPLGAVVPYECYGFCCVALGFHDFL